MQSHGPGSLSSHRNSRLADQNSKSRITLLVPKTLVKKVKDAIEVHRKLEKKVKIRQATLEELKAHSKGIAIESSPDAFLIPTKLFVGKEQIDSDTSSAKQDLLQSLGLADCQSEIGIVEVKQAHDTHGFLGPERGSKDGPCPHEPYASEIFSKNPLARTIGLWLDQLPHEHSELAFARDIVLSYTWTYMIYPPLLLLPPTAPSDLSSIFASKDRSLPKDLSSLWCLLSRELKTSHIALNAPILPNASKEASAQGGGHPQANVLRSPTGLAPLYGDFGPALPVDFSPSTTDFASAFWCTAQQNGIFQTWAPRYTMFSRGNISEKARILRLKTLTTKQVGSEPMETSAVDLYAGIGYFAFSYAKAGVGKVLCWEINPWSVEGLRRGAKRNRWGVEVIKDGQASKETADEEARLIVFQESNEHAARRMSTLKDKIPLVRHVNCGLLPSSKDSWEVAVQMLGPAGGWIHVHENIAKKDIEARIEEIVGIFDRLVMNHCFCKPEEQWKVECEHVEQVKSYAPGVMHYVLDISISPKQQPVMQA
ncbi:hypothetical protein IMSHALPRED_003461 [Imshaugia aleurites]|uniref:tRNA(Phe) (4-demethylwyosine(37)-C(7)) aminocarboxypropyltransferase n=1 Tax=Imshaugia aleurites TaxID=172621 RepID=A0A8H3J7X4_9LECA|nr:hypothetical protein IMSHALPRED_003461 [Imshaugia aleurites]